MRQPFGTAYAREVTALIADGSTTEETYYPAIRDLWKGLLAERNLPFQVRTGTSEARQGAGGVDRPDVAVYDQGDFLVVMGEVKTPDVDLKDLAISTDRNDQIGRYLAQTGVVLLCNVRSVGLLACKPAYRRDPRASVSPSDRELLDTVDLWPDVVRPRALRIAEASVEALANLLERAVTEFAPIGHPSSLARILARQARRAKSDLPDKFDSVKGLLEDYRVALGLSFEDKEGSDFFRSSLVQTAFYALFAAWTLWHRADDQSTFTWDRVDVYLRIPFLRELFYEFRHPTRLAELHLAPHLDRAAATLNRVDRQLFFTGFTYAGLQTAEGDDAGPAAAITYFYEPFLEAFDPDLRKQLGVWYTPPEIVRYQVRKVHGLLQTLGCRHGFADERVVVLDPCCGTGAYLLEVVRLIAEEILARGDDSLLATELLQAISKRVLGFEILTAPFVIAQLQLYLLLSDLGVTPASDTRPAVFLTNALTGWEGTEQVKLNFPELQDEHDSAQSVKRTARIIVVLGNPPYNRFAGTAMAEEADLVDHYKGIRRREKKDRSGKTVMLGGRPVLVQDGESELYARWGVRKQLLDDLYIRFFRLAEKRIGDVAEQGIVSFISNSSYLTGRSHPIMRESILTHFDEVWIDNLNGDKYRTGKVIPDGLPGGGQADQSVFTSEQNPSGIQVGVCISTFLKRRSTRPADGQTMSRYRDFWGGAKAKRRSLLAAVNMPDWPAPRREEAAALPEGPREYELIHPTAGTRWMLSPKDVNAGFEAWPALDELFPTTFQGVNPNRGLDGSIVDHDRNALAERMKAYFGAPDFTVVASMSPVLATVRARYSPEAVWKDLRANTTFDDARAVPYLLFPLDLRWLYYEPRGKLLNEKRPEFWDNLAGNEFFVTVPQPRQVSETRPLLTRTLVDLHVHDRGSVCFPRESVSGTLVSDRTANLAHAAWAKLKDAWTISGDLTGASAKALVGRLFRLALAIMHSPQYEQDHADALAQDWAHLPIPTDARVFEDLASVGDQIATLLDPCADAELVADTAIGAGGLRTLGALRKVGGGPILETDLGLAVSYFGAAPGKWIARAYAGNEVQHPALGERTGDLFLNDAVMVAKVPERVWQYEMGGYPVLKKWLGYRQQNRRGGAPLTLTEARHFRSMVQRLAAVLLLHDRLDALYAKACEAAFTAEDLGLRP